MKRQLEGDVSSTTTGFEQIEVRTHTGTARFRRRDFARELVLATPLANQFAGAATREQEAILADVTDAVSACGGRDGELSHPLTANVLTAVAPDRVGRVRESGSVCSAKSCLQPSPQPE